MVCGLASLRALAGIHPGACAEKGARLGRVCVLVCVCVFNPQPLEPPIAIDVAVWEPHFMPSFWSKILRRLNKGHDDKGTGALDERMLSKDGVVNSPQVRPSTSGENAP